MSGGDGCHLQLGWQIVEAGGCRLGPAAPGSSESMLPTMQLISETYALGRPSENGARHRISWCENGTRQCIRLQNFPRPRPLGSQYCFRKGTTCFDFVNGLVRWFTWTNRLHDAAIYDRESFPMRASPSQARCKVHRY